MRSYFSFKGCSKHSRRFAGLEACFLLVTVVFLLFLFDKFRLKHLLQADSYGNEKPIRKWTKSVFFVFFDLMGTRIVQIRIAKFV